MERNSESCQNEHLRCTPNLDNPKTLSTRLAQDRRSPLQLAVPQRQRQRQQGALAADRCPLAVGCGCDAVGFRWVSAGGAEESG